MAMTCDPFIRVVRAARRAMDRSFLTVPKDVRHPARRIGGKRGAPGFVRDEEAVEFFPDEARLYGFCDILRGVAASEVDSECGRRVNDECFKILSLESEGSSEAFHERMKRREEHLDRRQGWFSPEEEEAERKRRRRRRGRRPR